MSSKWYSPLFDILNVSKNVSLLENMAQMCRSKFPFLIHDICTAVFQGPADVQGFYTELTRLMLNCLFGRYIGGITEDDLMKMWCTV